MSLFFVSYYLFWLNLLFFNFTVEEVNLVCIFAGESRSKVIIERALQYLDDLDMEESSNRMIRKL